VRDRLTEDDVEALEASSRSAKAHRAAATRLLGWAVEENPDDDVSPAQLVSAAAWHLDQAGDTDAALDLHRRAVASEGQCTPDARCELHAALLAAGLEREAAHVADDVRRSRPRLVDIASMASTFEMAGDLTQAHRWAEMGVSRLDRDDEAADDYAIMDLLNVRRLVRRELGFPPDELDDVGR
jgi:hypothetical protein